MIAADPIAANTVYVLDSGRIFKSGDGGSTWTNPPAPVTGQNPVCTMTAFAIHPTIAGTWLAAEYCGTSPATSAIFKTTDGGNSWNKTTTVTGEIDYIAFNAGSGSYVYASGFVGSSVVFQISTDAGSSWTAATGSGAGAIPATLDYAPQYVAFGSAPSDPKTIYLRIETFDNPSLLTFFKTSDGGLNWKLLSNFPSDPQLPRAPGTTAVDPANPNLVFAGAVTLYRSTDGGNSWSRADALASATAPHGDNHAMIFSPDGNTAYESNDGGVWSTTTFRSPSITWNSLNVTFGNAEFRGPLGMDPTNPNRAFGGLQDNSTVAYAGAVAWSRVGLGGDGLGNAIDTSNPSIVYSVNDGYQSKSTSGGSSGSFASLTNAPRLKGGYLAMDFLTPATLYGVVSTGVTQTADGGISWQPFGPASITAVDAFAVAPSDSNTAALISTGAIPWITSAAKNGPAATWRAGFPANSAASLGGAVQSIAFDANDPKKMYVLGGFTAGAPLMVSYDGAITWQARNFGPITEVPQVLLSDPDLPNTLYVGTANSVYRSSDGGANWFPLAAGFPIVQVTSIQLQRAARILRAGTKGRGVWDLAVPINAPRASSATITSSASGYQITVNGTNFTSNSIVRLNGTPLLTSFVSATQLTAAAPAASVTASTAYYAAVDNPGSGGLSDPVFAAYGPTIFPNGIQNAASPVSATFDTSSTPFQASIPAGTFAAIYGSGLASATTVSDYPFPPSTGGVQVLVNGNPAPLYVVSPTLIIFVMPWEASGTTATVAVVNGTTSNTVTIPTVSAPQVFTTNQQGYGQGAVLIAGTASLAAPTGAFPGSRPISKGEFASIYITGMGAVQNAPPDGTPPPGLAPTVATPQVRIGCLNSAGLPSYCPAAVQYSGLTPTVVGLYQINIQIPVNAMSGSAVPLEITIPAANGLAAAARYSNFVTIAVQ